MNGWKLVPVNPTPGMIAAGMEYHGFTARYKAMLAAAPQPPSVGGEVEVLAYPVHNAGFGQSLMFLKDPTDYRQEGYEVQDLVDRAHVTDRDQQIARLRLNISEMNDEAKVREQQIAELQARVEELECALTHVRDKIRQSDVSWGTKLFIDNVLAQQVKP